MMNVIKRDLLICALTGFTIVLFGIVASVIIINNTDLVNSLGKILAKTVYRYPLQFAAFNFALVIWSVLWYHGFFRRRG